MTTSEKIIQLTRQLYPTGRAFRMFNDSYRHRIHRAMSWGKVEAYDEMNAILDQVIPDNDRFTADDAKDWERRLGLVTNAETSLSDRKLAILRKMKAPGKNPAKGHYLFLQRQLRAAGFDVYVYENRFPDYPSGYYTQNPADLNGDVLTPVQLADGQLGDFPLGYYINHMIVNSIDNDVDIRFGLGGTLRSTIFIGGTPLGTMAQVPASREVEFRQLVLTLKRAHIAAFLFIEYT